VGGRGGEDARGAALGHGRAACKAQSEGRNEEGNDEGGGGGGLAAPPSRAGARWPGARCRPRGGSACSASVQRRGGQPHAAGHASAECRSLRAAAARDIACRHTAPAERWPLQPGHCSRAAAAH
jgi:hypothetical protein